MLAVNGNYNCPLQIIKFCIVTNTHTVIYTAIKKAEILTIFLNVVSKFYKLSKIEGM